MRRPRVRRAGDRAGLRGDAPRCEHARVDPSDDRHAAYRRAVASEHEVRVGDMSTVSDDAAELGEQAGEAVDVEVGELGAEVEVDAAGPQLEVVGRVGGEGGEQGVGQGL